ncbi:MAG: thermonuclease family protein [Halioglobus sp.]|nr:thermonuclease family protein [Halioglobus sp.]
MRTLLVAIALFSLLQYFTTGTVSWPAAVYQSVSASLADYATRPDAAWRKATQTLEEVGAKREGDGVTDFDLVGRVVRIADGDTVSILDHSNTQHKVRLFGIDSPERDQPYGKAARKVLAQLIDEEPVGVVIVTTDSYGRLVGTVYHSGVNINEAMVARGYAWWYQYYAPHEHALREAELRARSQRLGLWAEAQPVPPWEWRRKRR